MRTGPAGEGARGRVTSDASSEKKEESRRCRTAEHVVGDRRSECNERERNERERADVACSGLLLHVLTPPVAGWVLASMGV